MDGNALDGESIPLDSRWSVGDRMKILVVEDNLDVGSLFTRMLAIKHYDARLATTPTEALEIVSAWEPDFVLLDLGLPRVEDGYILATQLRNQAGLKQAKIIALSGYAPDEERQVACGIDGHLMKPVRLPIVLALLAGEPVASN